MTSEKITFEKSVLPPDHLRNRAYFFIFSGNSVFIRQEEDHQVSIPVLKMDEALEMKLEQVCFIGSLGERGCYSAHEPASEMKSGLEPVNIRALYGRIEFAFWETAGYARQIHDWNLNFRYCGRCGSRTEPKRDEHVRICPECGLICYPRVSPAAIIAVVRDNRILLARGVNFPNKKMFSVLAGFVEPGETLEDCVRREIREETGIAVKNIRYFKSQPWPFPDSLMVGFTAEYESGEIRIDQNEIAEADWFSRDNLPLIPDRYTIARELIDWFVNKDYLMKRSEKNFFCLQYVMLLVSSLSSTQF